LHVWQQVILQLRLHASNFAPARKVIVKSVAKNEAT